MFTFEMLIPKLKETSPNLKLSHLLEDYYFGSGLGDKSYKAADRKQVFAELVTDFRLRFESEAFAWVYILFSELKRNGTIAMEEFADDVKDDIIDLVEETAKDFGDIKYRRENFRTKLTGILGKLGDIVKDNGIEKLKNLITDTFDGAKAYGDTIMTNIPKAVDEFYERMNFDCSTFPDTSSVNYFIDTLSSIEQQEPEMDLKFLLNRILGLPTFYDEQRGASFEWYVMGDMMRPVINKQTGRETGVVVDDQSTPVNIGHVLAGIYAGLEREKKDYDTLFGSTIARGMLQFNVKSSNPFIGERGTWTPTCPQKYYITPKSGKVSPSYAQMIGHIDGIVLGQQIPDILNKRPSLRLSLLLEQYYSADGVQDFPQLKSAERFQRVKEIIATDNKYREEDFSENPVDRMAIEVK